MPSLFLSSSSLSRLSRKLRPKKILPQGISSAGYSSSVSTRVRSSSATTLSLPSTVEAQTLPITATLSLNTPASFQPRFKLPFLKRHKSRNVSSLPKFFKTRSNCAGETTVPLSVSPAASGFGLAQAAVIFKIVASIGDGAVNVPGLKAAAQVASEIVRIAQQTKNNSKSCLIIAEQACQLINALAEGLQHNTTIMDSDLVAHIDVFTNDLKTIQNSLAKIQKRKLYRRLFHTDEDAGDIVTCQDILTRSTALFQVKGQVQAYLGRSETKVMKEAILQVHAHILGGTKDSDAIKPSLVDPILVIHSPSDSTAIAVFSVVIFVVCITLPTERITDLTFQLAPASSSTATSSGVSTVESRNRWQLTSN